MSNFALDTGSSAGDIISGLNYALANLGNNSGTTNTAANVLTANIQTGNISTTYSNTAGYATTTVVSYLYQYMDVAFANSATGGSGFTTAGPAYANYYGLHNTNTNTISTNPVDYSWYQVSGGFGTTNNLYYQTLGGRQLNLFIGNAAPDLTYVQTQPNTPINLDSISSAQNNQYVIESAYLLSNIAPGTPSGGFYNFQTLTLIPPDQPVQWTNNLPSITANANVWISQTQFVGNNISNVAPATTWTTPAVFSSGFNGNTGPQGQRGFVAMGYVVTATDPTSYTNAQFTTAFSSSRSNTTPPIGLGFNPIAGDTAQFFWQASNPNNNVTIVRQFNGTNWVAVVGTVISGNLFVTQSINASRLNANDIYAINIQSTNANIGNVTSPGYWLQANTGSASFAGTVNIGNNLTVGNNAVVGNNLSIGANLSIGDSATIGVSLSVGNSAVIGSNLSVGNSAVIGSNLSVGNSAVIGSNLSVGDSATIGSNININGLVSNGNLNANTVSTTQITNNSITTGKIQVNSITGNLIQANTITGNNIQSNTISGNLIQANTITGNLIQANTITGNNIQSNTITGNLIQANTITGNLIQANTITGNLIQANTITATNIQSNTIIGNLIQANTITGNLIQANTITATNIQSNTITGNLIKANTITGNLIQANTITGNLIQANTITGNNIIANSFVAGSINGNAITANSISATQLVAGTITAANSIQSFNATFNSPTSAGFWLNANTGDARLGGNTSIGTNLTVGNNAVIGGFASIGSDVSIGGNLNVAGLITSGNLQVNTVGTTNMILSAVSQGVGISTSNRVTINSPDNAVDYSYVWCKPTITTVVTTENVYITGTLTSSIYQGDGSGYYRLTYSLYRSDPGHSGNLFLCNSITTTPIINSNEYYFMQTPFAFFDTPGYIQSFTYFYTLQIQSVGGILQIDFYEATMVLQGMKR